jgi:acylphosphatase
MSVRPTVRFIFHGDVQGVGFRWTTRRIARQFAVAGSVRNLSDGTVELIAQGAAAQVAAFRQAVEAAMAGHIERVDAVTIDVSEQLCGFGIRR